MKQSLTVTSLVVLPVLIGWAGGMELGRHPGMGLCLSVGAALSLVYLACRNVG